MITCYKSRRIILPDRLLNGCVYVEEGQILAVGEDSRPCQRVIDCGDDYLSPAFIDLHLHGGMGFDFGQCAAPEAAKAIAYHRAHGCGTLLPTLASAPIEELAAAIERLLPLLKQDKTIAGIHLEGPYFSKKQCGAQNTAFITPPIREDYLPFLEKYSPYIRRWSYAPELDDGSFCETLVQYGVIPSAGHTDATGAQLRQATLHGCRLTTHLYSCTSTITREEGYRRTGVVEETLLNDDLYAEIIADGCHLPDDLIRLVVKAKGRERVALVTDALSAAGQESERGELNGVPFIVENGVCRLMDRSGFCGSIATADRLVRTCIKAGISLVDSVYMAAATPADILRLPKGRIEAGRDADLIVFDEDIRIKEIYLKGEKV